MPAGHLDRPFSPEERLSCQRAYVRHQGLIRTLGRQLCQRYPQIDRGVVFSCIDLAFLKAFRAFDESKGKFSTILLAFSRGAIRHYLRDQHELVHVPWRQRAVIEQAKELLADGHSIHYVVAELGLDRLLLKQVLSLDEIRVTCYEEDEAACHRPTPMELLETELNLAESVERSG
jgi:DNA-directed RNA polymerase specialized sigma subunit